MSIYTVSQVAQYVRQAIEHDHVLADLYVTGEISSVTRSTAGHCYFTLKDNESQLRCVAFRGSALGADLLENGVAVTAHGRLSFYGARGDLQYYIDLVQPEGTGQLHLEFLQVKMKLEAEGLFDPSRKRQLPSFPKRIAVVTSKAGAVLRDVQTILSRRYPLAELIVLHTDVQGEYAVEGVVNAFRTLNTLDDIDVAILARGGGSLEDLRAFNTEEVARAIHASRAPVISAIGHETDVTIADHVADVRAPTPSAAAEMAVPNSPELRAMITRYLGSMRASLAAITEKSRDHVQTCVARLQRQAPYFETQRQRVDDLTRASAALIAHNVNIARERCNTLTTQLNVLHPTNTLKRGYALVERVPDHIPVVRTSDVRPGDRLLVQVTDGRFPVHVNLDANQPREARQQSRKKRAPEVQQPLWGNANATAPLDMDEKGG